MANIALRKKIIEKDWVRPEELTDNNIDVYSTHKGFTEAVWPKNLTLDLENVFKIETIRFLLWDRDHRIYKYRLLTSVNFKEWNVHYDSFDKGYSGWQEFNFINKINVRYIRIHCVWNSVNEGFHIVQLQAFDEDTPPISNVANKKNIRTNEVDEEKEIGSGLSLTQQMKTLIDNLEQIIKDSALINPKPFEEIISKFRIQTNDIESLESSVDGIRREIILPVQKELEYNKKYQKFSVLGFYIGFIGFIVSIFAILNGIFNWI